jgi:hypothetical protein
LGFIMLGWPTRTRTLNVGTKNRCVTNYTIGQLRVQIYSVFSILQTFFNFLKVNNNSILGVHIGVQKKNRL